MPRQRLISTTHCVRACVRVCLTAQKISPDTSSKVQIQVVLHDGSSCTFHFANDSTSSAARDERDGVKDMLVQLLAENRAVPSKELEEKNR